MSQSSLSYSHVEAVPFFCDSTIFHLSVCSFLDMLIILQMGPFQLWLFCLCVNALIPTKLDVYFNELVENDFINLN